MVIIYFLLEEWRRLVRWVRCWPSFLASCLTLGLILWLTLSSRPVGDMDVPVFPGLDKVVHLIMFGWLALMLIMDVEKVRGHRIGFVAAGVCCLISASAGVGVEFLQQWMEAGRSFEVADMWADSAGAVLVWIGFAVRRLRSKSQELHTNKG